MSIFCPNPTTLAIAAFSWTTFLAASSSAQGRPTGAFESADPAMFKEDLSGIPFLVGAYALIWLVLLVYVVLLRRRTDAVVKEVASLRAQIEAATRPSGTTSPADRRPSASRSAP
ncbi:MAG: hypothetical protein IV100_20810 [Myxococcales bacterium]|nr:hypothetical protein [Myxococcales bacterium]